MKVVRWIRIYYVLFATFLFMFVGSLVFCASDNFNLELLEAAANGDIIKVTNLLIQGADVDAKDNNGITALMAASKEGKGEIVKTLLTQEADVNAKNSDGRTALMAASHGGHNEIVQLL